MTAIRKRSDAFVETEIDDEKVVMNLENGEFFSLRDTALAIWGLIDGTLDRAGLANALAAEFDAPEDQLAADLDLFLEELRKAQLIELG
jgi:pyrroloquinoline quinone biosynthesis protein D